MADMLTDADTAPVEADEPSTSLMGRSGKLLMGGGLLASAIAHLTLGGVVLFGSPRLFATVPETSITVDIVTPTEFAQASQGGSAQSLSSSEAAASRERSAPEAKTQQQVEQRASTPPVPPPPPPQAVAPPARSPPPQAAAPPAPPPPPDVPAEESTPPEKAAQPREALPDPARIAELLGAASVVSNPDLAAPPSDNAARLSGGEIAAFKAHVKTCWVTPTVASDAKPNVAVRIALAPDGRLRGKPEILAVSSASSVDGPALVQSVMRALTQCQPYNTLPAQKYKEWKFLDLNFSQDAISDVTSSRNGASAGPKG